MADARQVVQVATLRCGQDQFVSASQAPQLLFLVEGFTWVACGSIPASTASDWCHHWLQVLCCLGGSLRPVRKEASCPSVLLHPVLTVEPVASWVCRLCGYPRRVAVVTVKDECVVSVGTERGISSAPDEQVLYHAVWRHAQPRGTESRCAARPSRRKAPMQLLGTVLWSVSRSSTDCACPVSSLGRGKNKSSSPVGVA